MKNEEVLSLFLCFDSANEPANKPRISWTEDSLWRSNRADRTALDFAIANGIPHGGWCPKGRKAEDGAIDIEYQLKESPSANYLQRTEWNARDADATVIFTVTPELGGGSKKTVEFARKHGRLFLHLSKSVRGTIPEF